MAIDWTHLVSVFPGKWIALAEDETTVLAVSDTANEARAAALAQTAKFLLHQVPDTLGELAGPEAQV